MADRSTTIGFGLHMLVETPAALGFALAPSSTLPQPQPHAHAVIRQYGVLLLVTNLIVAALLLPPPGDEAPAGHTTLHRRVATALALYHIGPTGRALLRLSRPEGEEEQRRRAGKAVSLFRSPGLHLLLHVLCFAALVRVAVGPDGRSNDD
ncbi:hypothetical protein CDD83_11173 [Cordyceps sp. RAO-2017]|nr:hypothetical protein CDD83_11173 [Cordyceps sp. RAO-2017]